MLAHAQIPGSTLREQLKSLERLHGVDVRGLERIGDEPARVTAGNLRGQVMGLLRNYSYVVLQTDDDGVRGVRILASQGGARPDVQPVAATPAAPSEPPVPDGGRAKIDGQPLNATLMGFAGREYDMSLTIDSRVQRMILPASMKTVLGFDDAALEDGVTKTARGDVPAELGLMPAVRAGGVVAENIEVAFVSDDAIEGRPVLGRGFLKNFNVTYDSDTAQLILMPL